MLLPHLGVSSLTNDPYFNNVSLLLSARDGVIKDYSKNNHSISVNGNTAISSSQAYFGNKSIYFDGSGDYLTVPVNSNLISFGYTDIWTLEILYYKNSGYSNIASFYDGGRNFDIGVNSSNLRIYYNGIDIDTTILSNNTWYHIAIIKNGTNLKVYLNGVLDKNIDITGRFFTTTKMYIGSYDGAQHYLNGYINYLRITKGIARPIQVPTQPFSNW